MKNKKFSSVFFAASFAALLCCTVKLSAQESDFKNRFSISGGGSFPVSQFGSTNLLSDGAGFAKTGLCFGISYSRLFTESFGLILSAGYDGHSFDSQSYAEQFAYADVDAKWRVISDPWVSQSYTFGILWRSAADKFEFDLRAQFGVMVTTYPEFDMLATKGSLSYHFYNEAKKASAFEGVLGFSLAYGITEHIGLSANFDFASSIPVFDGINIIENGVSGTMQDRQSVSVIQTTLGVNYTFGK